MTDTAKYIASNPPPRIRYAENGDKSPDGDATINQKYFDSYIKGTYPLPDNKEYDLQTYHHHVRNRMACIDGHADLIHNYAYNVWAKLDPDKYPNSIKWLELIMDSAEKLKKGAKVKAGE